MFKTKIFDFSKQFKSFANNARLITQLKDVFSFILPNISVRQNYRSSVACIFCKLSFKFLFLIYTKIQLQTAPVCLSGPRKVQTSHMIFSFSTNLLRHKCLILWPCLKQLKEGILPFRSPFKNFHKRPNELCLWGVPLPQSYFITTKCCGGLGTGQWETGRKGGWKCTRGRKRGSGKWDSQALGGGVYTGTLVIGRCKWGQTIIPKGNLIRLKLDQKNNPVAQNPT